MSIQILMIDLTSNTFTWTETVLFCRILVGESICSGQLIHPVVWTSIHHVMFDKDGLSFLRSDHGKRMVGILEIITILTSILLDKFREDYFYVYFR